MACSIASLMSFRGQLKEEKSGNSSTASFTDHCYRELKNENGYLQYNEQIRILTETTSYYYIK